MVSRAVNSKQQIMLDGWLTCDFTFIPTVISVQLVGNKERLCVMEPCLRSKRSPPLAGLESRTAVSAGQHLPTELPGSRLCWKFN